MVNDEFFNDAFDIDDGNFDEEEALGKMNKIMSGEVIPDEGVKSNPELTASEEFDPEIDGDTASSLVKNMGRLWVDKAVILGEVIARSKDFFAKDKGGFQDWLTEYCRIKYPMAMQLIRVSKLNPDTVQKIIDRGFTSSHVIKLLSLKYEEQQSSFLEVEQHPIDEDETMVLTREMTPKDVQDAIKIINKKPDPEISKTMEFFKVIKAIESVLDKTAEDFTKYVLENDDIDITELTDGQVAVLSSARRLMKAQTDDYLAVMKKVMPIEESKLCV